MTHTRVQVIADTMMHTRITTLECVYPRIIHGEVMTHRVFSHNAQSSRAMPTAKVLELPVFVPDTWTKNCKGMQAKDVLTGPDADEATRIWLDMQQYVEAGVRKLAELKVHKQHANRALEPWTYIRVLITSTDWDNFFAQRRHKDAQPEIQELAERMWEAMQASTPDRASEHMPYSESNMPHAERPAMCAARCARVSYGAFTGQRDLQADLRLAQDLWREKHMSPFEHVAFADLHGGRSNLRGWRTLREELEQGGRLL